MDTIKWMAQQMLFAAHDIVAHLTDTTRFDNRESLAVARKPRRRATARIF